MTGNRINPRKLLHSKWTACVVQNRERHFMVVAVETPEPRELHPEFVEMEAVLTHRRFRLRWQELQDSAVWVFGWR